uniref:No apical meristem-associated C-terminal domain-containing protein n=1 Tax=Oryza brachyantha TaxID=4533 RepID=J3MKC6_ORYBR
MMKDGTKALNFIPVPNHPPRIPEPSSVSDGQDHAAEMRRIEGSCCWQSFCGNEQIFQSPSASTLKIRPKAKDERNGKRKSSEGISAINEKLEKFIEARQMATIDREKMADLQESLANKKLETAKLAHKTAREKTKCKMLEMYKELLFASTSQLSEEALAEREKALESMRLSLFNKDD